MILSAQSIIDRSEMIEPFVKEKRVTYGLSYGLSAAGYDIRLAQFLRIEPGEFVLGSSFERFDLPSDLLMMIVDKSSWARRGLCVQNTVAEPGWNGYLTLELTNHSKDCIELQQGVPIAQVLFQKLDKPTFLPYTGKYQNQPNRPVEAM